MVGLSVGKTFFVSHAYRGYWGRRYYEVESLILYVFVLMLKYIRSCSPIPAVANDSYYEFRKNDTVNFTGRM